MNNNILKAFVGGFFLTVVIYPQAYAEECGSGYVKGVNTGNCIKASDSCGRGCVYTIDDKGNLNVTGNGNGSINAGAFASNLDIVTANIGEGIKSTGWSVFQGASNLKSATISDNVTSMDTRHFFENCSSLESLKMPARWSFMGEGMIGGTKLTEFQMPDTVRSISGGNMLPQGITNFVMPESVKSTWSPWVSTNKVTVYCTQAQIDAKVCNSTVTKYERDENGNLVVFNKDGSIKGVYNKYLDIVHDDIVDSYEKKNENTGKTDIFNGRGVLTSSYIENSDGSVGIYDANGKLTGLKNAKHITPIEAAELAKDGKNNTVTLTFK